MRRRLVGLVIATLLIPQGVVAQSPAPSPVPEPGLACIALTDTGPWTVNSLMQALLTGTVSITEVLEPSACGDVATPVGEPVVIKGGRQNEASTKRFALAGGDYELTLTGKASESSNVILALIGPGRPDHDSIWNEIEDPGRYEYSTYLYDVEPGDLYVEYNLPRGSWTVTITPR